MHRNIIEQARHRTDDIFTARLPAVSVCICKAELHTIGLDKAAETRININIYHRITRDGYHTYLSGFRIECNKKIRIRLTVKADLAVAVHSLAVNPHNEDRYDIRIVNIVLIIICYAALVGNCAVRCVYRHSLARIYRKSAAAGMIHINKYTRTGKADNHYHRPDSDQNTCKSVFLFAFPALSVSLHHYAILPELRIFYCQRRSQGRC